MTSQITPAQTGLTAPIHTTRAARRGRRSAIMLIAAGALLLTPISAPAKPPALAPQPPPSAGAQPSKLTQIYRASDGGTLYLRAEGTTVVGFAEHPVKKYAFVFRGTRTTTAVTGDWYDVAKGTRASVGKQIRLSILDNGNLLVRTSAADFGPDSFEAIDPSQVTWPGDVEAGFQDRSRTEIDGAFIGKDANLKPDGSRLYWREATTFGAIGVAEGVRQGTRPTYVSVYFGTRDAQGRVSGEYFDVPKGTEMKRGTFKLSPFPASYGRFYGRQHWDAANVGVQDRGGFIDPDYAIDLNTFAAALDTYFRDNVVGFGYAISRHGEVVRSDAGGSSYLSQTNTSFDINTPFGTGTQSDIGSSSKLVVATAVMRELDERGISVDSPVAAYFPSCWDLGTGWETMTFRRLLDHTSGLIRPSGALLTQDPTGYLFQKTVAETAPTGPTGYENQNYVMLGWILAGLVDKPKVEASFDKNGCGNGTPAMLETMQIFEAYVVDMLADQGVEGGWKWRSGPKAFPYNFADQTQHGDRTAENINPSGGLKMTADMLGRFMAKLGHGAFVKPTTVQAMKDGRLGHDGAVNTDSGLGWLQTKSGSASIDTRGYRSQVALLPGGVQVTGIWNSSNNSVPTGVPEAYRAAWVSALK